MKKISALIVIMILCLSFLGVLPMVYAEETNIADTATPIEIYLIAGQSNAVGYTKVDSTEEQAVIDADSRYTNGLDVMYYGYVEYVYGTTLPNNLTVSQVKLGKGSASQGKTRDGDAYATFGPELGMAKYFADNGKTGTKYGIIKYAAGGTAIFDEVTSTLGSQYGNWMSPSLIAKYGKASETLTGLCYNTFLQIVRQGLQAYKDAGYDPQIKGLAWMQGESESQNQTYSAKYAELLNTLISDLRTDLTTISGQDLSELKAVVAKIPQKYQTAYANAKYVTNVREQMDSAAQNDADLLLIDNDFVTLPGLDAHHYNVPDMLQVGHNFAEKLVTANDGSLPKLKVVCTDGGSSNIVSKRAEVDSAVAVTLTPLDGYEVKSYEFVDASGNAVDVVSRVVGSNLRVIMPSIDVTLKVTFAEIPSFTVTMSATHGEIYRTNVARQPKRGETVTFTFKAEDGYQLDKVTVNGKEITTSTFEAYPTYTTSVTEDLNVVATYSKIPADTDNSTDTGFVVVKSDGCNGVIGGSALTMLTMAFAVCFVSKKKH